jgi:hypothetical protein
MGSQESEETLNLLKELSVMKDLDGEYEAGTKTDVEREAYLHRQQRHREIMEAIKTVASRRKDRSENRPIDDKCEESRP